MRIYGMSRDFMIKLSEMKQTQPFPQGGKAEPDTYLRTTLNFYLGAFTCDIRILGMQVL